MDTLPLETLWDIFDRTTYPGVLAYCRTSRINRQLCGSEYWRHRYMTLYSVHVDHITNFQQACMQATNQLCAANYDTYGYGDNLNLAIIFMLEYGYEIPLVPALDNLQGVYSLEYTDNTYLQCAILTRMPHMFRAFCQHVHVDLDLYNLVNANLGTGSFIPLANMQVLLEFYPGVQNKDTRDMIYFNDVVGRDDFAAFQAIPRDNWSIHNRYGVDLAYLAQADALNIAIGLDKVKDFRVQHYLVILQAKARKMLTHFQPTFTLNRTGYKNLMSYMSYTEGTVVNKYVLNRYYVNPILTYHVARMLDDDAVAGFNFNPRELPSDARYTFFAALYTQLLPRLSLEQIKYDVLAKEVLILKAIFDMDYTNDPRYRRLVAAVLIPLHRQYPAMLRVEWGQYMFRVLNAYYLREVPEHAKYFVQQRERYYHVLDGVLLPPGDTRGDVMFITQLAPEMIK